MPYHYHKHCNRCGHVTGTVYHDDPQHDKDTHGHGIEYNCEDKDECATRLLWRVRELEKRLKQFGI